MFIHKSINEYSYTNLTVRKSLYITYIPLNNGYFVYSPNIIHGRVAKEIWSILGVTRCPGCIEIPLPWIFRHC